MNANRLSGKFAYRCLYIFIIALLSLSQLGWTSLPQPTPPPAPTRGQREAELPVVPAGAELVPGSVAPQEVLLPNGQVQVTLNPVDADYYAENGSASSWSYPEFCAGKSETSSGAPVTNRAVLRNPLSKIPPNATIVSARLNLYMDGWYDYVDQYDNPDTREINILAISSNWHPALVNWNHAPAVSYKVGSLWIGGTFQYYSLDITGLAQAWYSGAMPNYGLMLTGAEGDYGARCFYANEYGDPAKMPNLVVTYIPTAPTLSPSPTSVRGFINKDNKQVIPSSFEVGNTGSTRLGWKLAAKPAWINLSRTSGTVGPGLSETVQITFDTSTLTPDKTYSGLIQVVPTTAGAGIVTTNVNVSLTYSSAAVSSVYLPTLGRNGLEAPVQKVVVLSIGVGNYQSSTAFSGIRTDGIGNAPLTVHSAPAEIGQIALNSFIPTALSPTGANAGMNRAYVTAGNTTVMMLRDEQAAYEDIEEAFRKLDDLEDANTRVVITYAGHGGPVTDDNGDEVDGLDEFITAWDTDTTLPADQWKIIRDDQVKQWLNQLESTQVTVVIDSCEAGGMRDLAAPGRDILMSSQENENSIETSALQMSLFSSMVEKAFLDKTADANGDGWVSANEAAGYANWWTTNLYSSQHPLQINALYADMPLVKRAP